MAIEDDISFLERVPTLSLFGRAGVAHSGDRRRDSIHPRAARCCSTRRGGRRRLRDPGGPLQLSLAGESMAGNHRRPVHAAGRGRAVHRDDASGHRESARALDGAAHSRRSFSADVGQLPGGGAQVARHLAARLDQATREIPTCAPCWMRTTEMIGRAFCARSGGGDSAGATARRRTIYTSSVAVTGTWSDGRSQPRECLRTCMPVTRSASAGATQMWSSRRPLSAVCQSGER